MKVYALVRFDLADPEMNIAGTYFLPQAAMSAACGYGARGEWEEYPERALMMADYVLHAKEATWYVCPVEVMPSFSWEAARAVAVLLREVLTGIMKNGARR